MARAADSKLPVALLVALSEGKGGWLSRRVGGWQSEREPVVVAPEPVVVAPEPVVVAPEPVVVVQKVAPLSRLRAILVWFRRLFKWL
jgi:hypothetical protein